MLEGSSEGLKGELMKWRQLPSSADDWLPTVMTLSPPNAVTASGVSGYC